VREAAAGMRAFHILGMNVTIPHKVDIVEFLDEIDPIAREIGAVNTIVNQNGFLTGYNTDAEGFLLGLVQKGIDVQEKNVVLLGAGGASRAVAYILAKRGAHLTILNRTEDRAMTLASHIYQSCKNEVKIFLLDEKNLQMALDDAHILVNATSIGMTPDTQETLVPRKLLRRELLVVDVVYNPIKTRLLLDAEAAGSETVSGIEMFVYQGALCFEKWTGVQAPLDVMRAEVIKQLGHEERNHE
jgi:shikimate dehydrogenase